MCQRSRTDEMFVKVQDVAEQIFTQGAPTLAGIGPIGNLADLASTQSGFLKDYMAQPIDLNNEATEARLFELGRKRLDPVFDQRDAA